MNILAYIDRTSSKKLSIIAFVAFIGFTSLFGWLVFLDVSNVEWEIWVQWLVGVLLVLLWAFIIIVIAGILTLAIMYQKRHVIKKEIRSIKNKFLKILLGCSI